MPWWAVLLIAIGAAGLGALIAACGVMLYIAKGINW